MEAPRDIKKRPRLGSDGTIAIAASRSTRRRAHCVWRWSRTRRAVSGRCKVIFGARRHTFSAMTPTVGPERIRVRHAPEGFVCEVMRAAKKVSHSGKGFGRVEGSNFRSSVRSFCRAADSFGRGSPRQLGPFGSCKSGSEGAFDKPMSKNEVLEAVKPFFVQHPAGVAISVRYVVRTVATSVRLSAFETQRGFSRRKDI